MRRQTSSQAPQSLRSETHNACGARDLNDCGGLYILESGMLTRQRTPARLSLREARADRRCGHLQQLQQPGRSVPKLFVSNGGNDEQLPTPWR